MIGDLTIILHFSCPKCFKKKPSLQKEKKDWAAIELEER
jgi:hypothetical protein